MLILFPNSNIPSNVGNAFFYDGVKWALSEMRPEFGILHAPFPPDNPFGLSPKQAERVFRCTDRMRGFDALLLAGPLLDKDFVVQHGAILRHAKREGKPIILVSAGGRTYDAQERSVVGSILKEVRPEIFISRDSDTYDNYAEYAVHAHDGICFAFFVADSHPVSRMGTLEGRYMTATFDFRAEPDLAEHFGLDADLRPILKTALPARGTRELTARGRFATQRTFPTHLGPLEVIRPSHRPIRSRHLLFHKPGAFADFAVDGYLALYAHTAFTVTDRLHAAVATMCYGNPAYLSLESQRTRLLENVKLNAANGFTTIDMDELAKKKQDQLAFLEGALGDLGL